MIVHIYFLRCVCYDSFITAKEKRICNVLKK